jgi:hypothetical protein
MTKVVILHEYDKDGYLWVIIKVGPTNTRDLSDPEEARRALEEAKYIDKEVMRFKWSRAWQEWLRLNEQRLALAPAEEKLKVFEEYVKMLDDVEREDGRK